MSKIRNLSTCVISDAKAFSTDCCQLFDTDGTTLGSSQTSFKAI